MRLVSANIEGQAGRTARQAHQNPNTSTSVVNPRTEAELDGKQTYRRDQCNAVHVTALTPTGEKLMPGENVVALTKKQSDGSLTATDVIAIAPATAR